MMKKSKIILGLTFMAPLSSYAIDMCGNQLNDSNPTNASGTCLKVATDAEANQFTSTPSVNLLDSLGFTKNCTPSNTGQTYCRVNVVSGYPIFAMEGTGGGQAVRWCNYLAANNFNGKDDWRLPTVGDLALLSTHRGDMDSYGWINRGHHTSTSSPTHYMRMELDGTKTIKDSGADGLTMWFASCVSTPEKDFGDAPSSYTSLHTDDGPRHVLDQSTYMGSLVDSETDAQLINNDDLHGSNDEDGVTLVPKFGPGLDAPITVNTSTTGYLNAWIDWNKDGDFDDPKEHIANDMWMLTGDNDFFVTTPDEAVDGDTWARFRFSQEAGLNYYGIAQSGEVEDYEITIDSQDLSVRYFPGENTFATLAFEDSYPEKADYDMNDINIVFRVKEILRNGNIEKVSFYGRLGAYGAHFKNGIAVAIPGVTTANVNQQLTHLLHKGVQVDDSGLETDLTDASFIITPDLSQHTNSSCDFYRTEMSCKEDEDFNFQLHVTLNTAMSPASITMPYDPFIFASPNGYHEGKDLVATGKRWEVHLPGFAPTAKFDTNLFGSEEDASDPSIGKYFQTAGNHPWAILIDAEWNWPVERTQILQAYPAFAEYAESGGSLKPLWYTSPIMSDVYH